MLTSGDVVELDVGVPTGSEAGLFLPAVVVTAQRVLTASPTVIQVVPLTRTLRGYSTEVTITADGSMDWTRTQQRNANTSVPSPPLAFARRWATSALSPSRRFATPLQCSWISSRYTAEPAVR